MKKKFVALMHKPKQVIPATLIIALILGVLLFNVVGKAPVVSLSTGTGAADSISATGDIDLSFLKTGRIATVSVREGDTVRKGQVLATLDAGDVQGALTQARGALELAKAQYASLNVQYGNAKKQQDVLVANAYRTLLSSGLSAVPYDKNTSAVQTIDDNQVIQVSGSYTCGKAGSYEIYPYASASGSGYSFEVKGLETGNGAVSYYAPQAIGSCGLFITFPSGFVFNPSTKWVIDVPNTRASSYAANKNAYDLALATRDQVLKQLEANLGKNGSAEANIAQATIDSAQGAYEIAQAAYNNTIIVAPVDGTVSFVDAHLKVGQTVAANKNVITITR